MRVFDGGATRDDDDNKVDYEGFLSPLVLERFGEYMHRHRKQADGKLRDSDNWQRGGGIPVVEYMKSKWRHFMDTWKAHRGIGSVDIEESLCAELFNTQGYLHEILKRKRMENDLLDDRSLRHWDVQPPDEGSY
ncbi:MAG: hypothetical protein UR84_C0021G0012 [candidate division WS6 bacterium GW2011_GWD1_35_594]|nr:MAG: hypothetical protein UR84_C0021G0012 [candidate division WS6 bacterium GW2011_GWD1_35_594]